MNPLIPFALTILVCLSPFPTLTAGVADTDGKPVRNDGGSYYIVPYGSNGGLSLTQRVGGSPCPLYITRTANSFGVPLRLSSPLRIAFLPSSSPVSIAFIANITLCEGRVWQVTTGGQSYVTASGAPSDYYYSFAIEVAGKKKNTYKIRTYCKSLEGGVEKNCGDLGIIKENGLLGVTNDEPLIVQFKEASDPGESLGKSIM
ncbi:trypsin inhibitor BvTI-like [Chenopodium quinoa]|uniref:trypsin inhibitor BvTI-like n=1 Tax=Chenopodium quinoa TaxID=63459 RepID=UPI000B778F23|nr:trypsin inhibitor BvTI-like [Chenopodium quinoa]